MAVLTGYVHVGLATPSRLTGLTHINPSHFLEPSVSVDGVPTSRSIGTLYQAGALGPRREGIELGLLGLR
jgi:hypothetical protein